MDIQTANFEELKAARDEIIVRLREIEKQTIEELQAKAAQFGLGLTRLEVKKERRKRRTKQEMLEANGTAI